jgi:hypothetical protein
VVADLREHGAGRLRADVRLSRQNFRAAAVSCSPMRALGLAVSMFATGCAAAGNEADALVVPEAPIRTAGSNAIVPDAEAKPPAASPKVAEGLQCDVQDVPPTRAAPIIAPDETTACHVVPKKVAKAVRAGVRKEWMRRYPSGTFAIGSGCDRLGTITRIDLERSSGHGGTLNLARFELDAVNGEWSLLWIAYSHYARYPGEDADVWESDVIGTFEIRRGRIAEAVMAPIIERVRAATVVEPVEHPPPPKKNTIHLGSMGFSSASFGVALALVDDKGRGTEGFFAGYPGTGDGQAQGVRMQLAALPLAELMHDDAFGKTLEIVDVDAPGVRELFAERFWSARDRGEDFGKWFIRERFIALTGALGGDEHVPELMRSIVLDGDASVARSRVQAINAIAAITGFDRRYEDGVAREPKVVGEEVARACRPGT